ncbi:MAG TPA: DUF1080 domain-containing protein, partial [Bryobacteraceae bacterium]|nr:DUF1080 domain-containing protein [Bryobacteraceae bacterium]
MRTRGEAGIRLVWLYGMFAVIALSQPGPPSAGDQREIQDAVGRLVSAANTRDVEAVKAVTLPSFDARGEGWWFVRDGVDRFSDRTRESLNGVEVATLIRSSRLLAPNLAFADGFFRTIAWPGGDLAGAVSVTLVKQDGKWLVGTARFGAYHFGDRTFLEVKPAPVQTAAGPDGWITLFDGSSLNAFASPAGGPVSESWSIQNGLLTLAPVRSSPSRGLRTKDTFKSFELQFEWKLPAKGNSGVKYRLFYLSGGDASGHEYQLADDQGDPGAIRYGVERSGALYNQIAPSGNVVKPVGEFNRSSLIVRGRHCEHWLNGEKVVEYETSS